MSVCPYCGGSNTDTLCGLIICHDCQMCGTVAEMTKAEPEGETIPRKDGEAK